MAWTNSVILCLAFILGLASTVVPWGGYGILALGLEAAILRQKPLVNLLPDFWRVGPKPLVWLAAGVVGLLATLYFQARVPYPAVNDISNFITSVDRGERTQIVTVRGRAESTPHLTRSQQAQFWLKVTQLIEVKGENTVDGSKDVTGKLYVTVPLLQATGIHPGQAIAVTGSLYKPEPATNPGGFDFKAYLTREGAFAGLKGRQVDRLEAKTTNWGWWAVRQRIIRSQVRWLGIPEGPLLSAIVLGHRVVDLPYDVRDQFAQVGLAHTIVASGFKVSLILGLVLGVTRRFSRKVKFTIGAVALISYVGLTGLHPPVLRATVMGFGALIALVVQRRRKSLATLLIAATLLLLFNPLWIWDLGFQLSFLAALGLMIMLSPLVKSLDWLPPTIASLVAASFATFIWTLPLELHLFSVLQLYDLIINILTAPILSVLSIGGMIDALAALIWPLAGSALAWLLYYPIYILMALVQFFCQLPGSSFAIGSISVLQMCVLYGMLGLVCVQPWWRRRWWVAGCIAIGLVLVPILYFQATLFRVTVLAAPEPILVIQDKGRVVLVNSGDDSTARFTLLPFLQQQGVNHIDWAIATNQIGTNSGWLEVLEHVPVKTFYHHSTTQENENGAEAIQSAVRATGGTYQRLSVSQKVPVGSTAIEFIEGMPVWQLQIQSQTWLFLARTRDQPLDISKGLPKPQVLWSSRLDPNLVRALQPSVAIAATAPVRADTATQLRQSNTQLFLTDSQGAIQWTPTDGFKQTLEANENDASF